MGSIGKFSAGSGALAQGNHQRQAEQKNNENWANLGKVMQVWASLDKFGQVRASLDQFGLGNKMAKSK